MAVISHHTVSLDGFVAGPDDSMDEFFGVGKPTPLANETMGRVGAILAERRWYDLATERWSGVVGIYGGTYRGVRLFDVNIAALARLERLQLGKAEQITDLRFRVVR